MAKQDYFKQAASWADDYYTLAITSRNRYQLAFFACLLLCTVLVICLICLLPLKKTQLVVVHQDNNGFTWVTTTSTHNRITNSWQKTKAEIAHYIISRESYDPILYPYQSKEINLLSSKALFTQYELSQAKNNRSAAVNLLANKGYRTVRVHSILLLSKANNNIPPLAQANFTVTDHLFDTEQTLHIDYTALISWQYTGESNDPYKLLHDWDGFQVIKYQKQLINQSNKNLYQ